MHFEAPKIKLHSIKEFFSHYLMIVVSILTALALEQWVERLHHEHLAQEAVERIDAEVRHNLDEVNAILAHNAERTKVLESLEATVAEDIRSGVSKADFNAHLRTLDNDKSLKLRLPNVSRDAWELAVANQAVTWMKAEQSQKYSTLYTRQREYQNFWERTPAWLMNGSKLVDFYADLDIKDADPKETYHTVRAMLAVTMESGFSISGLQKALQETVSSSEGKSNK